MKNFNYHAPESLSEALGLMQRHGPSAAILAGGTDLMVQLKRRVREVGVLVSAKKIPNLDSMERVGDDGLRIGAFTSLTAILENGIDCRAARLLASVAKRMAGPAIRNVATIGGNLCHASPSADTAAALIALDATVTLASETQQRTLPVEAFFLGPGRSARRDNEVMVRIDVPDVSGRRSDYQRFSVRRAIDIAIVGVAACAVFDADGKATGVRIALGAVAPTPMRAKRAEEIVQGRPIDAERADQAGRAAAEECSPIDDVRASAGYRREMVRVLTRRALLAAGNGTGPEDKEKR